MSKILSDVVRHRSLGERKKREQHVCCSISLCEREMRYKLGGSHFQDIVSFVGGVD